MTNTQFLLQKCMTELFSFDRPTFQIIYPRRLTTKVQGSRFFYLYNQREYMFSNVHETFIGVNFSPRKLNFLTI